MRGLFVTGTDTGVGKTRVSTALAHGLAARGVDVRVRKPVESGAPDGPEGRVPADAAALRLAAGGREPLGVVCAHALRAPLSPERAAALEGVALECDALADAVRRDVPDTAFVIVEGAGGFYSPIARAALNADLAQALALPLLVVGADRLGTLNHVMLTIEAAQRRGLAIAGVVLSQPAVVTDREMDNAGELARWLGRPVLRLPHGGAGGPDAWQREVAHLAPLLDTCA